MKENEVLLRRRAASRLGLVHRGDALALGVTSRQLDRRVASGLLVPVQPEVYRLASAPRSWHQEVLAACLAAGPEAMASHRAAGVLWSLRGMSSAPVEITLPGPRSPRLRGGSVVHRAQRLDRCDVGRRGGIPVAAPALTLLGLAAVAPDKVEAALEDALLRGLVSMPWLAQSVERLAGSGRRGSALLRRLVSERDPDAAPTESVLEDVIFQLLREAGLPEPVRQFQVGRVRIDLAYPHVLLGIEADGRLWHGAGSTYGGTRPRPTCSSAPAGESSISAGPTPGTRPASWSTVSDPRCAGAARR